MKLTTQRSWLAFIHAAVVYGNMQGGLRLYFRVIHAIVA
jgi:hypothetical protein